MNKKRFKIGDWVHVKATMTTDYDNRDFDDESKKIKKVVVKKPANIIGQIVGLKRFHIGEYTPQGHHQSYDGEWEPVQAYITVEEVITVWEIKQGMLNKAVYALDEDVDSGALKAKMRLPLFYSRQPIWTDQDRQNMREEMADVPRDKNGRWIKWLT